MEDQNVQTEVEQKEVAVPCEMPELDLSDLEKFERKEQRIKEVAARVEINLNKPVR